MGHVVSFPQRIFTVLQLDDSPGVGRLLRRMADAAGETAFELVQAQALEEALGLLSMRSFDLMLLDSYIPPFPDFEQPLDLLRLNGYEGPVVLLSSEPPAKAAMRLTAGDLSGVLRKQHISPEIVSKLRELAKKAGRPPVAPPARLLPFPRNRECAGQK